MVNCDRTWYCLRMALSEKGYERFKQKVGSRIKELRIANNLVQEDMFVEGWLSTRSYQDLEKGLFFPKGKSIYVLCHKFGITPADLFDGIDLE